MAMIKVYLSDETKEALLKESEEQNVKTSKLVSNLIEQHLKEKGINNKTPAVENSSVKQKVCKIRLNGDIAEHVQEKSKEKCITPSQFVTDILWTYDRPVIEIPFLEDFSETFQSIRNGVRLALYYINNDPDHKVYEESIEELEWWLNNASGMLKEIYKELLRTRIGLFKYIKDRYYRTE